MDLVESVSSRSLYGEESKEPLHRVQDIPQLLEIGVMLPSHIQYLTTLRGVQDLISIHEWGARLCHVLLVETGYFPNFEGSLDILSASDTFTPKAAMDMTDVVRIPEFTRKLTPSVMFSEHGIYALKYKAILCNWVDLPLPDRTKESSGDVEMGEGTSDKASSPTTGGDKEIVPEQEFTYSFSNDVNVTMMILEDRLSITATCLIGPESRPISLQFTLNIEEFFVKRPRTVPLRLRGDQWIRECAINYTRLSVYFKNKFAILFLDLMDAVVLERRGLFSLPSLALVKIFKKSDVVTILRMSRTCTYFYNIVRDNRLWKFLLKRDFPYDQDHPPTHPIVLVPPPLHGIIAPPPTRETTEPSFPSSQEDPLKDLRTDASPDEPDYYDLYRQKYSTKYRRLLRNNSFPMRLFPTLRMGRRIPSVFFDRF